ncbi:hypothetical protein CK203_012354 [Vitis vinifera]|uniref:Reverse transcriptase zinc-binding domain-containing protein n=1 Tax=Vitis vinifera TaxID=29760 RepID=A0A438JKS3_VITVI|nr:hypothetical protein CK203_012354 [Vitis vinifera]
MEDRMLWKETKDEIFLVKSLYSTLVSSRVVQFPINIIWNPCVPTKVCFFAWEAYWGKVLTLDQLKKRGRFLANRCFLCCEEEESIDHILIQCSRARVLWELLFALFGVTWVLSYSVRDTLSGWCGFNLGKKRRKAPLVYSLSCFSLDMATKYIISAVLGSFAVAYACTTPKTVANKEWWEETDKKFQAWPRTAGPPVVMNPISRQNFIVKSQSES